MRFPRRSIPRIQLRSLAVVGTAIASFIAAVQAADSGPPRDGGRVLATIGAERVKKADVIGLNKEAFERQREDYDLRLRNLQFIAEEAQHTLLQQQLDQLLDRRALEMEARARGVPTESLLGELSVPAVTDDEMRAFYDSNKARTSQAYEQLSGQIRQYLATQHNDAATRQFYDRLRSKHGIVSLLQPFRVQVAATGPARGHANVPVTIVEFADFQCPYCKQEQAALQAVLAKYPNDVRLVFRHLPLVQLHPDALIAAEAAVCANRQGKFWEMHDALYADQKSLGREGVKATAQHLGLNADQFSGCIEDAATVGAVKADMAAADAIGITSTPYFFINGRPISGSVPTETLQNMVAEELRRAGGHG